MPIDPRACAGRAGALAAGLACVAWGSAAAPVVAALRPEFNLPSQQAPAAPQPSAPVQVPLQVAPPVVPAAPGPSEAYYANFGARAAAMPQRERDALTRQFRQRLAEARRRGALDEVRHYERMLGILAAVPATGAGR